MEEPAASCESPVRNLLAAKLRDSRERPRRSTTYRLARRPRAAASSENPLVSFDTRIYPTVSVSFSNGIVKLSNRAFSSSQRRSPYSSKITSGAVVACETQNTDEMTSTGNRSVRGSFILEADNTGSRLECAAFHVSRTRYQTRSLRNSLKARRRRNGRGLSCARRETEARRCD